MLDLALGAPEIGAVNFNILHNFLHILLNKINLQDTKIEYRGEKADRIKKMVTSLKSRPSVQLDEYNITDAAGEVSHQTPRDDSSEINILTDGINSYFSIISRFYFQLHYLIDCQLREGILKATKDPESQEIDLEKEPEGEVIASVVNDFCPKPLAFEELEQSVKQLQQRHQALEDLFTSPEIIERIKDKIEDPTSDVWQFINKRLDANEQGIDKLTAMIQDIVKGDAGVVDTSLISTRLDELENKVTKLEEWFINQQAIIGNLTENIITRTSDVDTVTVEGQEEVKAEVAAAETVEINEENVNETFEEPTDKTREITSEEPAPSAFPPIYLNKIAAAEIRPNATLEDDVDDTEQELQDSEKIVKANDIANLKNVEAAHDKALNDVTERVNTLEIEVGYLIEKVDNIQETDKTDPESINKFVVKVEEMKTDMEKIGQVMDKLVDDKDKQETDINTLLEQVEFLKTVKVDKDDLEGALADKADAQTVNRKVSHDQFVAACDDLARGLEETINKLTSQESIWQQALDEVQNEIATKLNRDELLSLKEFVNDKLKSLQEKLKLIIEARREIEAAGTKKMLRGVQCISCDKDVVMKTEATNRFRGQALPCTISLKPYLTYELDKVRKQQRILPHTKNMIQLEAIMQEMTKKVKKEILAKIPK
ncbi:glutamine-rich protein 2 [Cardiocondyla obscurior]|uniref:glutamine-rich protein 2 n=1 Tax=Cardiocondyla obscurior TaxID=286306 RepID=UPI0039655FD9